MTQPTAGGTGGLSAGLGPHGEVPASPDELIVSEAQGRAARARALSVGVVLHSTAFVWSTAQVAGIASTLTEYGAYAACVTGADFRAGLQIAELERVLELRPDGIISIPVDNEATAAAYRAVARAGVRLVLIDNAPIGLQAGRDYVSLISSDNFGNGRCAAEILAPHVPLNATVGIITLSSVFSATNERELGFRKWMREHRPDIRVARATFSDVRGAGAAAIELLEARADVAGLFVAWDGPALDVVRALRDADRLLPLTSVDLGTDIALEIARADIVKGVGVQRPYDLGCAEARAMIAALTGGTPPRYVTIPAFGATPENLLAACEIAWRRPAPPEVVAAVEATKDTAARRG